MNDRLFLDSNVLVYCYSKSDATKLMIARNLANDSRAIISTQVINETTNVLQKKYKINWIELSKLISDFEKNFYVHLISPKESKKACGIAERYGFSFYDSLMVAAALECNCDILYSEDLQHNQIIDSKLTIINPFL